MNYKNIYKKVKLLEDEYSSLKKEMDKQKIFSSEKNLYLKKDKEKLKEIWEKYIILFKSIKKLLLFSHYKSFLFSIDYNKLILKKYILHFYFRILIDLLKSFWKHEDFVRVFLDENFIKDYWYFAKYLYRAKNIYFLNIPKVFIYTFSNKVNKDIYDLVDWLEEIDSLARIKTDYNNFFYYIKYRIDKLLFWLSKHIGFFISHTKFSTRKSWLVKKENIKKYLEIAKSWDIFLSRWNWNASNISIPGFWKHMAMYLGKWDYLKQNFKWNFLKRLDDEKYYIIEATWEWVTISDIFDFAWHIDYLGVSRTTFSKEKIKRSLKNVLSHFGKWYDHIFNFYSDKRMVCSALVLKSYAKEYKKDEGISIELEKIWISLTYPPNSFISKLQEDKKSENREVEWIFFIDSIEKTWENFVSNVNELLKTWKRAKFSMFLK